MAAAKSDDTKTESDEATAFMNDIKAEMARLKQDIAALGTTISSYGKTRAGDAQSRATEMSDELLTHARHTIEELRKELDQVEGKIETQVREKPVQSLLMALGLGFIISLLIRR